MRFLKILIYIFCFSCACDMPAQNVYVTKTGKKYHKSTCHYLKNSKKEITLEHALELSFEACSVCKPFKPEVKVKTNVVTDANNLVPSKKASATQCTGKTISGVRCKRMTVNSNGRCYQH